MNRKFVFVLIVLFIFINLALFFLLNKDNFLPSPTPSSTLNLPTRNAGGAVTLTYNYEGKITGIIPIQNGEFEVKLDTPNVPQFFLTRDSQILMLKDGITQPATINDLKTGTNVAITMTLHERIWTLKTITVQ